MAGLYMLPCCAVADGFAASALQIQQALARAFRLRLEIQHVGQVESRPCVAPVEPNSRCPPQGRNAPAGLSQDKITPLRTFSTPKVLMHTQYRALPQETTDFCFLLDCFFRVRAHSDTHTLTASHLRCHFDMIEARSSAG